VLVRDPGESLDEEVKSFLLDRSSQGEYEALERERELGCRDGVAELDPIRDHDTSTWGQPEAIHGVVEHEL
jgi:hypothetical protein